MSAIKFKQLSFKRLNVILKRTGLFWWLFFLLAFIWNLNGSTANPLTSLSDLPDEALYSMWPNKGSQNGERGPFRVQATARGKGNSERQIHFKLILFFFYSQGLNLFVLFKIWYKSVFKKFCNSSSECCLQKVAL